jgi:hypothetical protein
MTSKSEKFRELIEEETSLRNQLSDCETAQFKMLSKAFKSLGLKIGTRVDMFTDTSYIAIGEINHYSLTYWRNKGGQLNELYEITLDDLLDPEVTE